MKIIHYICTYTNNNLNRDLLTFPSAITKIEYIKGALKEASYKVVLFSIAEGQVHNNKFIKADHFKIDEQEEQIYINTFGRRNLIIKSISRLWMLMQLLFYLLFKVKKNEDILIYHSVAIMSIISIVRVLTTKSIYFEIEESFAAAYGESQSRITAECKYWQNVSGYICVNDIIAEKCQLKGKVAVCYGEYNSKVNSNNEKEKNKIQILYAGVIEKEGTDAFIAVETALYLRQDYFVNILGYGEDSNIHLLLKRIKEVNSLLGYNGVNYFGCLSGDEYITFLQKCHIGLTTRVLNDSLSDYTFPSKTLVYLCNNLIPVCSPISCIKKSEISEYVSFCEEITPQSVAKTILAIDHNKTIDYSDIINQLNKKFVIKLKNLFG